MPDTAASSPSTDTRFAPSRLRGESSFATKLKTFAADIKLSHTLFALPWALLATFLAADGAPSGGQLLLILVCMVTARTAAMAANRLLDARLDALNPRTARRAIPSGSLSPTFVLALLTLCSLAFITATFGFRLLYNNPWPLVLSVPVLAFISAYPLLKRFTRLCHYYLGAALALAPLCAWIAIKGNLESTPLLMAAAVLLWTAGFDIIYATADTEHDRMHAIHSAPARLGIGRALAVSRVTHVGSVAFLVVLGWVSPPLSTLWYSAVALTAALMVVQHSLVRPGDLSRVNVAFFTVNGIISVLLGAAGIADAVLA